MPDERQTEPMGDALGASFAEWLEKAREFRDSSPEQRSAEQQGEVLAEVEFYEWLVRLYDTGNIPDDAPPRPSYLVLQTTLDALDHTIARDSERVAAWRERGETVKADAALARVAKARATRRRVEAIQPAEGSIEPYRPWYESHR